MMALSSGILSLCRDKNPYKWKYKLSLWNIKRFTCLYQLVFKWRGYNKFSSIIYSKFFSKSPEDEGSYETQVNQCYWFNSQRTIVHTKHKCNKLPPKIYLKFYVVAVVHLVEVSLWLSTRIYLCEDKILCWEVGTLDNRLNQFNSCTTATTQNTKHDIQ